MEFRKKEILGKIERKIKSHRMLILYFVLNKKK